MGPSGQHVPRPACTEFDLVGFDGTGETRGEGEERPAIAVLSADTARAMGIQGGW